MKKNENNHVKRYLWKALLVDYENDTVATILRISYKSF
jgi:hypothetical protein